MEKYYNPIIKKNTVCQYRFKTEEEFINEFGSEWANIVQYLWVLNSSIKS